jgi:hypothetical protein
LTASPSSFSWLPQSLLFRLEDIRLVLLYDGDVDDNGRGVALSGFALTTGTHCAMGLR